MENERESCDDVTRKSEAIISKWRRLVTQASSIVLPIDEREIPVNEIELETYADMIVEHDEVAEDDYREYFPTFVVGISVMQLLFYAVFDEHWLTLRLGYDPYRRHEIWRYLTASIVHSSVSHLCGNLVMQLILGVLLEIVHRWKRIAIIYLASCVGGTLLSSVCDQTGYTVGASTGAMGLLSSHLATILLNWHAMDYKKSRFFCVLLYIIWEVCQAVYSEKLIGQNTNISHAGHFGGAVTGFLVSILVLKTYQKHTWRKTKKRICIAVLCIISVVIFLINVISSHYPPSEWNFRYKESFQKEMIMAAHVPPLRDRTIVSIDQNVHHGF